MEYSFYFHFMGCCHIAFKEVFMFLGSLAIKVLVQWFQMSLNIIYLIRKMNLQICANILVFSPNVELTVLYEPAEA